MVGNKEKLQEIELIVLKYLNALTVLNLSFLTCEGIIIILYIKEIAFPILIIYPK